MDKYVKPINSNNTSELELGSRQKGPQPKLEAF
jgi:hypothetical protein